MTADLSTIDFRLSRAIRKEHSQVEIKNCSALCSGKSLTRVSVGVVTWLKKIRKVTEAVSESSKRNELKPAGRSGKCGRN